MFDRLARMALMIPGEAAIVATNDTWMRSIWRGLGFCIAKGDSQQLDDNTRIRRSPIPVLHICDFRKMLPVVSDKRMRQLQINFQTKR